MQARAVKWGMRALLVGLGLAAAPGASALGTAGTLDAGFGTAGVAESSLQTQGYLNDLVILGDDRIVQGGYLSGAQTESGPLQRWVIRCLLAEGDVDTGFGTGGEVTLFGASRTDFLRDLVLDASGRILACGSSGVVVTSGTGKKQTTWTATRPTVVRLDGTGTLDATFGSGGQVHLTVSNSTHAIADGVAVLPGGKILVVGDAAFTVRKTVVTYPFLARLHADGSLDGSFGSGGIVIDQRDQGVPVGTCLAVDASGRILVGHRKGDSQTGTAWAISRYLATGSVDTSYGSAGTVTSTGNVLRGMRLDAAGRLVAVGNHLRSGGTAVQAIRYDASGVPDASFGSGGITQVDVHPSQGVAGAPAFGADGTIALPVTVMHVAGSSAQDAQVLRLLGTGAPDSSFGSLGFSDPVPLGATSTIGQTVAVDAAGGILLGGYGFYPNPTPPNDFTWFLARFLPD